MMCRAVQACSYGGNHIAYGEYRSGSSKSMAEIIFFGEKTAIGYVQKALILRVKEPIGGTRAARVQLRYHVWFKGSLATSNLSVGATRYSIP